MDVTVQHIRVTWTKRSRGGPGAARRNSTARGFPLPPVATPLLHRITMDESTDFAARQQSIPLDTASLDRLNLAVRQDDRGLRVDLKPASCGMPRRHRRPPAVRLAPGEWLRWQINYRFVHASSGAWWYAQDTVNVGYGTSGTDVFLVTPTRSVDERAPLR